MDFLKLIFGDNCKKCKEELQVAQTDLALKEEEYQETVASMVQERDRANLLDSKVSQLEKEIHSLVVPNPLEDILNNKYPKKPTLTYSCRYIDDLLIPVDPRVFFRVTEDIRSIALTCPSSIKTNDEKAYWAEQWALKNLKYVTDAREHWQFAFETRARKKGDCEDHAILIANLLLALGIPYYRIRLNAGDVNDTNGKSLGHAYVTYCRETDNEFVVLDSTYFPTTKKISERETHRALRDYYTIWFSLNERYCFSTTPKEKW